MKFISFLLLWLLLLGLMSSKKKHVFEHDHHRRWTGSAHYYQMQEKIFIIPPPRFHTFTFCRKLDVCPICSSSSGRKEGRREGFFLADWGEPPVLHHYSTAIEMSAFALEHRNMVRNATSVSITEANQTSNIDIEEVLMLQQTIVASINRCLLIIFNHASLACSLCLPRQRVILGNAHFFKLLLNCSIKNVFTALH